MTLAERTAPADWFKPAWWPYWFGGMPLEFTYAPGFPLAIREFASLSGCPVARAFHIVVGLVFCAGPVALFVLARRLSGSASYSFAAAIAYSLLAPTELIVPDAAFDLRHATDARRFYLAFVWDEAPHLAALALASIAIACLHHAFETRKRVWMAVAGALMAAAVLTNTFGVTILAITLPLWALAFGETSQRLALAASISIPAYLVASPWLPPSLLHALRVNANAYPESAWSARSWLGILAVVAACGFVLWLSRRWRDRALRFFLLLAVVMSSIPVVDRFWKIHWVPQPGRYTSEMELALVLLVMFSVRWAGRRLAPRLLAMVLAAALAWPAAAVVIKHRRFAKSVLKPADIEDSVEARVARWVTEHPGSRIFAAGSIGQWLNLFSAEHQFGGGAFPTALNPIQQVALNGVYRPQPSDGADETVAWLKAFGADRIVVTGPRSKEFWKPYERLDRFSDLTLLWQEDDTRIHQVGTGSIAHLVPHPPRGPGDLRIYVAAIESSSPAGVLWEGSNRVRIRALSESSSVLSVQINYHRGWRAEVNGERREVHCDGLGQIWIDPACSGPCEVILTYGGDWEAYMTRGLSGLTILGVLAWLGRRR
ncbi:MAG: hypothetical protein ACRD8O_21105, partial [Bryobacteraceae bacterium]